MAEATDDKKAKKNKNGKRRNYERELSTLRLQCEISIETLMELEIGDLPHPPASTAGQLIAYRRILAKIDAGGSK